MVKWTAAVITGGGVAAFVTANFSQRIDFGQST